MKELENITADKTKVSEERPVRKEKKFLGSMKKHPGHKLYQLELSNGEITLAQFEQSEYHIGGGTHHKLLFKDGFIYTTALNKKNAEKKFIKIVKSVAK